MDRRRPSENAIAAYMREATRKLNGTEVNLETELVERRHREIFDMCYSEIERDPRHNWSEICTRDSWSRWVYSIASSHTELFEKHPAEMIEAVIDKIRGREVETMRGFNTVRREEVTTFLKECCHESFDDYIAFRILYDAYSGWCTSRRAVILPNDTFFRTLRSLYNRHPFVHFDRRVSGDQIVGLALNK